MSPLRFVLAGGGTSGHINPALAIAEQIRLDHPDAEIRFCGTARGLESSLVPRAGFDFMAIRARGLPTRLSPDLFRALADYAAGYRKCRSLLKAFRPNAVIGTGGYVCSPVVAAASSLKIPVLLHEQNAFPGRSNRLMARRSQAVCVSFPGTEKRFSTHAPITLTGNPVREVFFHQDRASARAALGLDPQRPVILAIGGSLGARNINQAILGLDLPEDSPVGGLKPHLILAAGKQHYTAVAAMAAEAGKSWLEVHEYLYDMHLYMAAADLLICRAGAMTCMELSALGRPAVLVPYPFAANDHQTFNARVLADAGAALLCLDSELTPAWLASTLQELFSDPDRLAGMGRAAAGLAKPDATSAICRCLYEVMR